MEWMYYYYLSIIRNNGVLYTGVRVWERTTTSFPSPASEMGYLVAAGILEGAKGGQGVVQSTRGHPEEDQVI